MTWIQVGVLGFLIFVVGWSLENRLGAVIDAISVLNGSIDTLRQTVEDSTNEITTEISALRPEKTFEDET